MRFILTQLKHRILRGTGNTATRLRALLTLHGRRRLLQIAAFLTLALLLWTAGSTWWLFHSPWALESGYPHWHAKRVVPIVEDRHGRLVGLWPWPGVAGEALGEREYLAAAPTRVPEPWWRMVVLLEDGNRDRWYHLLGIDWSQAVKIPLNLLLRGDLRGGSTLEMQLVKTLNMDTDARGIPRLYRKLRDLAQAPAFAVALPEEELRRWVAAHFPLVDAGPHGLESAARLLFQRPAAELDLARQAILAAAVKRRVRINPHSRAARAAAERAWRLTVARARLGLRRLAAAGVIGEEQLQQALRELDTLRLPDLRPDPGLSACLDRRSPLERDLAARKLDVRAKFVAQSELRQVDAELRPHLGRAWPSQVAVLHLTLDRDANCLAKWRLEKEKRRWARAAGLDPADTYLVLAVADGEGRLLRFRSDTAYPRYLPFRVQAPDFRIVPADQDVREIGSIAKAFAALLAGREGDVPDTQYFRLRRPRLVGRYPYQRQTWYRNADGFTGHARRDAPGAAVSAARAFARSDNLAVMERLARLPGLELQAHALLQTFGFRPPMPFDPVETLALGNLHGAPREVQGLFALLAHPDPTGTGDCRPTLVAGLDARPGWEDSVRRAELARLEARLAPCAKARRWLANHPRATAFAQDVLAAVLDPRRHGTAAAHLGFLRQGGPLRPRLSIAKTGTVAFEDGRIRWVWLAGALTTADGRRYSYVAHAGANGVRRHDLGRHTGGGQLGALLAPVLRTLLEKDSDP